MDIFTQKIYNHFCMKTQRKWKLSSMWKVYVLGVLWIGGLSQGTVAAEVQLLNPETYFKKYGLALGKVVDESAYLSAVGSVSHRALADIWHDQHPSCMAFHLGGGLTLVPSSCLGGRISTIRLNWGFDPLQTRTEREQRASRIVDVLERTPPGDLRDYALVKVSPIPPVELPGLETNSVIRGTPIFSAGYTGGGAQEIARGETLDHLHCAYGSHQFELRLNKNPYGWQGAPIIHAVTGKVLGVFVSNKIASYPNCTTALHLHQQAIQEALGFN